MLRMQEHGPLVKIGSVMAGIELDIGYSRTAPQTTLPYPFTISI